MEAVGMSVTCGVCVGRSVSLGIGAVATVAVGGNAIVGTRVGVAALEQATKNTKNKTKIVQPLALDADISFIAILLNLKLRRGCPSRLIRIEILII